MGHDADQENLRDKLALLLGPCYPGSGLGAPVLNGTTDFGGWCLDDLAFTSAEGEVVPGYFLRPPEGHRPVPAVVYAHAHGNRYAFGRDELIEGRPSLQGAYASDLIKSGIAALCLEMPCFGARQDPVESARSKALLWRGETLFGQMLAEQRGGVDFLVAAPQIDSARIGVVGFSMGSTLAFWLSGLDTRIRAAAALCSFADLATLIADGAHDGHGDYMTVPGLLAHTSSGAIAGLTAPRALQICCGHQDWSTPQPALDRGLNDLRAAYRGAGTEGRLHIHVEPDTAHQETPAMRGQVMAFLARELVG